MSHQLWTRPQLLAAFNLYCRIPFGRLHRGNPDIIRLSEAIGRTPSAVAMKLTNFAAFDPVQQARGIRGLANTARADKEIWSGFTLDPEAVAVESQLALQTFLHVPRQQVIEGEAEAEEWKMLSGPTEVTRLVRVRLIQSFFRDAVLTSYESRCAMCQLDVPELVNASHIIPWRQSVERRADPRNGLALCAIHDRAFDRGLLTLDSQFRIVLSQRLKIPTGNRLGNVAFRDVAGKALGMPQRFAPDPLALAFHRDHIFRD